MDNEIKLDKQGEIMKGLIERSLDRITNNDIKFASKEGVKIPTKLDENAGYDIYAFFNEDYIEIKPHETKMIPTGLYSAFSEDYVCLLHERGSTGTKGIGQRSGCIDSGYRGEWMVPLTNHNNKTLLISKLTKEEILLRNKEMFNFNDSLLDGLRKYYNEVIIYPYSKAICQALFLPIPKLKTKVISIEELQNIPSKRGDGKLGSSGK